MTVWLTAILALGVLQTSEAPSHSLLRLEGDWAFRPGDDTAWAAPVVSDGAWERVRVPGAWERRFPDYDGFAWYRTKVTLPPELEQGPVGLRLGVVGDAFQVFWNGVPIATGGSFPPRFVESVTPAVLFVPQRALQQRRAGEPHSLAIRVYNEYAFGGLLGGATVGRYDQLAGQRGTGEMVVGGLIAFFLAIGAYHLAFFLRRREARENAYFAMLCVLAVVYGATFSTTFAELVIEQVNPQRLRLLALLAAGPVYLALIARLFELPTGRVARGAVAALLLAILAVGLLPLGVLAGVHRWLSVGVGVGLVCSATWAARRLYQREHRYPVMLTGVIALTVGMVWDLLGLHGAVPMPQVLPEIPGLFWIGFLSFVVAVGFETASSFAVAEVNARTDPLTGLVRRHIFEESLTREAERRRRAGGLLTLIVLDLDYFKKINDTYGHRAGDVVLERVGHLLRHNARNIDLPARLGGEEFAVMLSDTDAEGAMAFINRFRDRLRDLKVSVPGGVVTQMTASVGIAISTGWTDTEALVDAADRAMYQAKQAGRDRVTTVFLPSEPRGRAAPAEQG